MFEYCVERSLLLEKLLVVRVVRVGIDWIEVSCALELVLVLSDNRALLLGVFVLGTWLILGSTKLLKKVLSSCSLLPRQKVLLNYPV